MSRAATLPCIALLLASCTMTDPQPPAPQIIDRTIFLPSVREEYPHCLILPTLQAFGPTYPCPPRPTSSPAPPPEPIPTRPPIVQPIRAVFPAAEQDTLDALPAPSRSPIKTAKPKAPDALIADATQRAMVLPSERGYHGPSVELRYTWQPGRLYVLYLSTKATTLLYLPVGEKLKGGLDLPSLGGEDGALFETSATYMGNAEAGTLQAVLKIHPLREEALSVPVDTILLTESGRSYNLRLLPGKHAMLAVRFEIPTISTIELPKVLSNSEEVR